MTSHTTQEDLNNVQIDAVGRPFTNSLFPFATSDFAGTTWAAGNGHSSNGALEELRPQIPGKHIVDR